MKGFMKSYFQVSMAAALLMVSACSSTNVKNSENVEEIYKEAVVQIDKGHFLEAGELLDEVRHRFPQSRFAALAELRTADMHFKQDAFTEAAASYGVFVELYPNHVDAPYALYQRALSYFNDAPEKIARDQIPATDAAKAADQLIHRYPNSPYLDQAKLLYKKARLKLAEKEAYIAEFYERRDAKLAAYRRWLGLKVSFADLKEIPEAQPLLALAEKHSSELGAKLPAGSDQAPATTGASD